MHVIWTHTQAAFKAKTCKSNSIDLTQKKIIILKNKIKLKKLNWQFPYKI